MQTAPSRMLAPCLVASAVVLAGLLVSQIGRRTALPAAEASTFNQQEAYTFLSAAVSDQEEALFVIDNAASVLLVYQLSGNDNRMILSNGLPLDRMFTASAEGDETTELSGDDEVERQIRDRRDR